MFSPDALHFGAVGCVEASVASRNAADRAGSLLVSVLGQPDAPFFIVSQFPNQQFTKINPPHSTAHRL
jgi:NAD(P)H-hydrate repair Nnr-like enzyme with NAD(P)H-hydrate dehydratase domain